MSDFLDRAVHAHVNWKLKILSAINSGERIDRDTACADDKCELGAWIHGDGMRFATLPEFQALREKHKEFHACVAWIAELIEAKQLERAKQEVAHGAYKKASLDTVDCIHRLKALRVVAA